MDVADGEVKPSSVGCTLASQSVSAAMAKSQMQSRRE